MKSRVISSWPHIQAHVMTPPPPWFCADVVFFPQIALLRSHLSTGHCPQTERFI